MKMSRTLITLTVLSLLASACGKHDKNPAPELEQMKKEKKSGNDPDPGPQVITNTVYVTRDKPVIKESNTVNSSFITITPATAVMMFTEGKTASYSVTYKVQLPNVKLKLIASGLPAGATLTAAPTDADPNQYVLNWAPAYSNMTDQKISKVKISFEVAEAANQDRRVLEGLSSDQEVLVLLQPSREVPKDVQIVGLPAQITEGTAVPFTVTAVIPGVDDKSGQVPVLEFKPDQIAPRQGMTYQELDGSRHVIVDPTKKSAEYLGNYKWKFNRIFDTTMNLVQAPLSLDGKMIENAPSTHVRMSYQVSNSKFNSSVPAVKQVEIVLVKKQEGVK